MVTGYKSDEENNDIINAAIERDISLSHNSSTGLIPYGNLLRIMTDDQLKELFEEGDIPTNDDFIAIIDSKVNKQDAVAKKELYEMLESYHKITPEQALEWYSEEMQRRANESSRISSEETRKSDEFIRQEQEDTRQKSMANIEATFNDLVNGTGFATYDYVDLGLSKKSNIEHTHSKNEILDFEHNHTKSNITDFDHTHPMQDITGLSLEWSAIQNKPISSSATSDSVTDVANSYAVKQVMDKANANETSILSLQQELGTNKSKLITSINSIMDLL